MSRISKNPSDTASIYYPFGSSHRAHHSDNGSKTSRLSGTSQHDKASTTSRPSKKSDRDSSSVASHASHIATASIKSRPRRTSHLSGKSNGTADGGRSSQVSFISQRNGHHEPPSQVHKDSYPHSGSFRPSGHSYHSGLHKHGSLHGGQHGIADDAHSSLASYLSHSSGHRKRPSHHSSGHHEHGSHHSSRSKRGGRGQHDRASSAAYNDKVKLIDESDHVSIASRSSNKRPSVSYNNRVMAKSISDIIRYPSSSDLSYAFQSSCRRPANASVALNDNENKVPPTNKTACTCTDMSFGNEKKAEQGEPRSDKIIHLIVDTVIQKAQPCVAKRHCQVQEPCTTSTQPSSSELRPAIITRCPRKASFITSCRRSGTRYGTT